MLGAILLAAGCFAAHALMACNASRSSAAAPQEAPLYHGDITEFVPAAGLRWLVVGSPLELARQSALTPLRERWIASGRLAAFAASTGIDLLRTERALAAGYDIGTLYIADASGWLEPPERLFTERLAGTERTRQRHAGLWHISGVVGTQPRALVRVDDTLVAFAIDDPLLAGAVELRALGRAARVPPAFDGASLSSLPSDTRAPTQLAVYLLGPLDAEWAGNGAGLLAATQALAVTLSLQGATLDVSLVLSGVWQHGDEQRLRDRWQAFATSSLGRRLGADRSVSALEARGSETLLTLRTRLDAGAVVAGFQALMLGNVSDLLDGNAGDTPLAPAP